MARKKTDNERFREFLTGKSVEELRALKDRLEDVLAAMTPNVAKPAKKRRAEKPAEVANASHAD